MRRLPEVMIALLAAVVAASLHAQGQLRPVDDSLLNLRMSITERPSSDDVVYIAIDAASLKDVGRWPWPRDVHARLIDTVSGAGAADIFLDIDFEYLSGYPDEDHALAQALERAGGSTVLPVFIQRGTPAASGSAEDLVNRPHELFAAHGWPALVNVWPDRSGLVRYYPFSAQVGAEDVPSVASILSGVFGAQGAFFPVDYARDPGDVPTYSAADVLRGAVPASAFRGRHVVVGAHALELSDYHAVPVHGVIPGAMIHVLATETLLSGVIPQYPSRHVEVVFLLVLLGAMCVLRLPGGPWMFIGSGVVAGLGVETLALVAYQREAILVQSAAIHLGLLVQALARLSLYLDLGKLALLRKSAEAANARRILQSVFSDSSDALVVVDDTGKVVARNDRSAGLLLTAGGEDRLHRDVASIAGRAIERLRAGRWEPGPPQEIVLATEAGDRVVEVVASPSKLTTGQPDRPDRTTGFIATLAARDVTDIRRQQDRIRYLSEFDDKTGALRRHAFLAALRQRLGTPRPVVVLAVNLHRFKTVNLTLGRDVGDRLLVATAQRLRKRVADSGSIARISGDGFAIFSDAVITETQAIEYAWALSESLREPYDLDGTSVQTEVHVGYTFTADPPHRSVEHLLDEAEAALDTARLRAGPRIERFDPDWADRTRRTRRIERAMRHALEREEFHLLYQPQVDLADGRLIGVEALVRWHHPELGPISPGDFIEVAEASGFIHQLGRWVLNRACADIARQGWDIEVSVNVSTVQLRRLDLVADVTEALTRSGLPPSRLVLELTESFALAEDTEAAEIMRDVEMLGVAWALDDFGTGYSSLSYISSLPFRKVKLDRRFVATIAADPTSLAIVRSVRNLCDEARLGLLCEGVERPEDADMLRREGCREAQGYLFGKPMSLDDLRVRFGLSGEGPGEARRSG